MKFSTAHVGLGAVLPCMVLAGQPREVLEQRAASNYSSGNGVGNGNIINSQVNSNNNNSKFTAFPMQRILVGGSFQYLLLAIESITYA